MSLFVTGASLSLRSSVLPVQALPIRGVVVDGKDGKPIDGAQVWLSARTAAASDSRPEPVTTDERGAFLIHAAVTGDYTLTATKPPSGFAEYDRLPFSGSGATRWFTVSGPTSGVVLKLWRYPSAEGFVWDENGEPIAGATVRGLRSVILGGREVLQVTKFTLTDRRGAYALTDLRLATYMFVATPPTGPGRPSRPSQYYSGATMASAAARHVLSPSESARNIDFRIGREKVVSVYGTMPRLPGLAGKPVVLELYSLAPGEPPSNLVLAAATVSREGAFSFPAVAPGTYEIRFVRYPEPSLEKRDGVIRDNGQRAPAQRLASVSDEPTWWAAERVDVLDKDVAVHLQLQSGVRVQGRVAFDGDGEQPAKSVLPTLGVHLRSLDHRFFAPFQVGAIREDGSFSTVAVPTGRYVIGMLDSYPGFHVKSVSMAGREVSGSAIELDRDVSNVVITLSPGATEVRGHVAGQIGKDKFVLVWPQDESLWSGSGTQLGRIRHATTVDGSYQIALFPGSYRIVAIEGLPPEDWESPGYLRSLAARSERIIVNPGASVLHNPPLLKAR